MAFISNLTPSYVFVVVVLEIVIIAVLFSVSYILIINDPKNEIFRRIKTKERQP